MWWLRNRLRSWRGPCLAGEVPEVGERCLAGIRAGVDCFRGKRKRDWVTVGGVSGV